MSAQDNIKVVQAYLANHDPKFMAEDATFQDFSQVEPLRGREAISAMLDMFYHTAFSEARAEVRNLVADDKSIVLEFTFHGVNTGSLMGMPPTNKRVEIPMCAIYDVEGGVIRRARLYYDSATMAKQLGLIPRS
ncbi:MAG TPA: ester cyclase [Blastocatellia bacterium]|nr:ester cyclase [Blastocatellia bacterium]